MMLNGVIAALVAITAASGFVAPWASIVIGLVSGGIAVVGVIAVERIGIDDPIGAVAVHGFAGIWGTLSVGLFATGKFGVPGADGADVTTVVKGLFYGGGIDQLKAQALGCGVAVVAVFGISLFVMYLVKLTKTLRVSRDGELEGLDIHEHGTPAYHMEFGQGVSYTTLVGSGRPFGETGTSEGSVLDQGKDPARSQ
jgi:Amt family ammonium transporter